MKMDQNLGRFEIFEVDSTSYDPYPDSRSHLKRQLRITGETVLLRSPGIALSGIDREIGCKWYQKNIRNSTLPGNVYASRLDCSLHEIDEARRAVSVLYQQVSKFGHEALPRIFTLLVGSNKKVAILELCTFLKNLQHNLKVIEQCVPGQNSGTPLTTIIAQDPISRSHHCLIGRLFITLSEVVIGCKCSQIAAENFHLLLEFGDDLLRIAFLMMRFTCDVHPAIGSAILKYSVRLGDNKSLSSHIIYDEIQLRAGPYIPYFRVGERTDAGTVYQAMKRLHYFMINKLKYIPENMLDLIDEGMIIAANALMLESIVTIDNLVGLWFCKQFRYKKRLAVWTSTEKGPEVIEELADTVYRYNNPRVPHERMVRFDLIKHVQSDIRNFLTVMMTSLTCLRTDAQNAGDHPAISANRKRVISFLTRVIRQLYIVLGDPTEFSESDFGPYNALYDEQEAYMNKLVYERLAIGSSGKLLPLVRLPVQMDASKLTTTKPDIDRLMCLERWPKETVMHLDME